ncbi:hypothetical protein D3C85_629160 [compost metagenome]
MLIGIANASLLSNFLKSLGVVGLPLLRFHTSSPRIENMSITLSPTLSGSSTADVPDIGMDTGMFRMTGRSFTAPSLSLMFTDG